MREKIRKMLEEETADVSQIAEMLGINVQSVRRKMRRMGIEGVKKGGAWIYDIQDVT